MTDRTGQAWRITLLHSGQPVAEETILVVSSATFDPEHLDDAAEHSCLVLGGERTGSLVSRDEHGGHWSQPPPHGVAFERIAP